MNSPPKNPLSKLSELIQDIKFAMLTTRTAGGALASRPLTTQDIDESDDYRGTRRRTWATASRFL